MTLEERFWAKVDKDGPNGCWLWTASTNLQGYGQFFDGKTVLAHRFAYERLVGPIPEGLVTDHLCRTPLCVNPAHLEPVTQRENMLRGETVIAANARKTHCKRGHPLSGENLVIDGQGWRQCRICLRIRWRRKSAARRAAK